MNHVVRMLALVPAVFAIAAAQAGPEVPPGAEALDAAVKRLTPEQQEAVGTALGLLEFARNCSGFLGEPSYFEDSQAKVAAGLQARGIDEPTTAQLVGFLQGSPRPGRPVTGTLCDVGAGMTFTESVEKEREIRDRLERP